MNNNYEKAYVEVLEILKYLPKEEYEKIPKQKIQFYLDNCDKNYKFDIDISKSLRNIEFLKETNAIIITLFRDYFTTLEQKEKLEKILLANEEKYQKELRKKYNPDNIFKEKKEKTVSIEEQVLMVEYKENIFKRLINWLKESRNNNSK